MTTPQEGLFRDNETNNTSKNNRVKNLNWWEAEQLAIYKGGQGVEPGTHPEQHQLVTGQQDFCTVLRPADGHNVYMLDTKLMLSIFKQGCVL